MSLNLTMIFGPEATQIDTACIPIAPENPLVTSEVSTTVPVPVAAVETDAGVEVVTPHSAPEPVPFDPFDRPDPNLRGLCQPPIHPRDPDRLKRVLTVCDKCGSTEIVDVEIHGGQSTRRDCAKCRRTLGFPKWYGRTIDEEARLERVERLLGGDLRKHVRPASEMNFNYKTATAIARQSQPTPRRSQ